MSRVFKSTFFPVCLAIAMLALTGSAAAQVRPRQIRPARVRRNVKDPAMVAAAKDSHAAHLTLKEALPIYEGHRVLAMKLCALADRDIKEGMKGLPASPQFSFTDRKPLRLNKNEEKALAKYTPSQIQQSNALLQKAVPMIQNALQALGQAAGDYGGYRTQAANSLNQALQEINIALQLTSGSVIHP